MTLHETFNITCICGKTHARLNQAAFTCECGRKSVIDFEMGYTEKELIEMLNDLDQKRDKVVHAIEIRRQRVTA